MTCNKCGKQRWYEMTTTNETSAAYTSSTASNSISVCYGCTDTEAFRLTIRSPGDIGYKFAQIHMPKPLGWKHQVRYWGWQTDVFIGPVPLVRSIVVLMLVLRFA